MEPEKGPDPLELELQMVLSHSGGCDLNLDPLQEQQVLLITAPAVQSPYSYSLLLARSRSLCVCLSLSLSLSLAPHSAPPSLILFYIFFGNRVSLCSSGWPRTHYTQTAFKLTELCLPLLPKCYD